jgi:hypothetical protein
MSVLTSTESSHTHVCCFNKDRCSYKHCIISIIVIVALSTVSVTLHEWSRSHSHIKNALVELQTKLDELQLYSTNTNANTNANTQIQNQNPKHNHNNSNSSNIIHLTSFDVHSGPISSVAALLETSTMSSTLRQSLYGNNNGKFKNEWSSSSHWQYEIELDQLLSPPHCNSANNRSNHGFGPSCIHNTEFKQALWSMFRPNYNALSYQRLAKRIFDLVQQHDDDDDDDDDDHDHDHHTMNQIYNAIQRTDAFLTTFVGDISLLLLAFGKPNIVVTAHRFDYMIGCNEGKQPNIRSIAEWKTAAYKMYDKQLFTATNDLDAEYIQHFLGFRPKPIYETAEHWRRFRGPYTGDIREFLVFPHAQIKVAKVMQHMIDNVGTDVITIKHMRDVMPKWRVSEATHATVPHGMSLKDWKAVPTPSVLLRYTAAIVLPYAQPTVSISEPYQLGLPIFAPTIEFAYELRQKHLDHFWRDFGPCEYNHGYDQTVSPVVMPPHPNSTHTPYDPHNLDDWKHFHHWMQFADIYQWDHVMYFSSWQDLRTQLLSVDMHDMRNRSKQMRRFFDDRALGNIARWKEMFSHIQRHYPSSPHRTSKRQSKTQQHRSFREAIVANKLEPMFTELLREI